MNPAYSFLTFALLVGIGPAAPAQLAPPMLRSSKPIGAGPGNSVALEVVATDAGEGTSIRFDDPRVRVEGFEAGKDAGNGRRTLKARVIVPKDAEAGPLRFRVVAESGVSDPGRIVVGRSLATIAEAEPNNSLRKPQSLATIPMAVEGTISPGDDVDVFAVEMEAGQTLVAEAIAARAGSRLDAWVAILGPDGRELAADDDTFGKDAAAWVTVPAKGRYLVTIQDANGRSRDGGIEQKMTRPYRLEVGRLALAVSAFPAGARAGRGVSLRLIGANLPEGRFEPPTDATPGDRSFAIPGPLGRSNPLAFRVGAGPEVAESEPDDDSKSAMTVVLPAAINGTLDAPDARGADVDLFRLKAAPGSEGEYAITVHAARVGSPADPVLAVLDAQGRPRGEDDDKLGRDARVERRVDSGDGLLISVRDYFGRGGPRYVYRVEVEPVARGLAIAADLGHRTIPRGGSLIIPLRVERRGFAGPVTVVGGVLPPGVAAAPVTIPAGESTGLLAISATLDAPQGPFSLPLAARDVPAPATFTFRERGPLDEVPREGDPAKGPRETTLDVAEATPTLAVAAPAPLGLVGPPGPITVPPGGKAEVTFTVERRAGSEKKAVKVRLLPGKALAGFEAVKDLDLAAGATATTFVLQARADAQARGVTLAALAWFEGTPDLLGVASGPVPLVVIPKDPAPRP